MDTYNKANVEGFIMSYKARLLTKGFHTLFRICSATDHTLSSAGTGSEP